MAANVTETSKKDILAIQKAICPKTPHIRAVIPNFPGIQIVHWPYALASYEDKKDDINRVLIDELNNKCVSFKDGWWTYEICFLQQILQVHYDHESGGNEIKQQNVLGHFTKQRAPDLSLKHNKHMLMTKEELAQFGLKSDTGRK